MWRRPSRPRSLTPPANSFTNSLPPSLHAGRDCNRLAALAGSATTNDSPAMASSASTPIFVRPQWCGLRCCRSDEGTVDRMPAERDPVRGPLADKRQRPGGRQRPHPKVHVGSSPATASPARLQDRTLRSIAARPRKRAPNVCCLRAVRELDPNSKEFIRQGGRVEPRSPVHAREGPTDLMSWAKPSSKLEFKSHRVSR